MDNLTRWGIELILAIQQFHGPALDNVFVAISSLGGEEFYLFLLPLLFWCVDFGLGVRLASLFFVSVYVNTFLKDVFQQPRPFDISPSVQLSFASGYGLPSGHAQSAVVIWGILAKRVGRAWFWVGAVVVVASIGFSRVYLGVHFPTDVAAGWLVGTLLLALYLAGQERLENWLAHLGPRAQVLLALTVPVGLFLAHPVKDTASVLGALAGIGIGLSIMRRYVLVRSSADWRQLAVRFAIGGVVALALYLGLSFAFPREGSDFYLAFRFLRYGVIGAWLSLGAPWLFQWLARHSLMGRPITA